MHKLFATVVKPPYLLARQAVTDAVFERRYGVRTSGRVSLEQLGIEGKDRREYLPAGLLSLRRILRTREVGPQDVFVDFGSGMGRVVLQAALMYPFRRVHGVELSTELHTVATSNISAARQRLWCRDVVLTNADALDYEIPEDVTVAFFYNPFQGETFRTVIQRLISTVDRNPRELRIIYGNPVEEDILLSTGRVQQVRALRGMRPGAKWSRSNAFRMYRVYPM